MRVGSWKGRRKGEEEVEVEREADEEIRRKGE